MSSRLMPPTVGSSSWQKRITSSGFSDPTSRSNTSRSANALNRIPLRSEEHTSELQSRLHLVCRLLLEKKKEIEAAGLTATRGQPFRGGTADRPPGARLEDQLRRAAVPLDRYDVGAV